MSNEAFENTVTLTDEDGNEVEFEVLDVLFYKDEQYAVLFPAGEQSEEVVILRLEQGDKEDEINFVGIDDESVVMAVFELFKERYESEYEFLD